MNLLNKTLAIAYGEDKAKEMIEDEFNTDWLSDVITRVETKYQDIEFNNNVTLDDLIKYTEDKKND